MKMFKRVFNGGVVGAFCLIIYGVLSFVLGRPLVVQTTDLVVYDVLAVVHIAIMGLFAARMPVEERSQTANTFYTAGFLHTLFGLGIAIGLAGAATLQAVGLTQVELSVFIIPMGAAVIPHAIGVFIGHSFEAAGGAVSPEVVVLRQLAVEGERANQEVAELYKRRRKVLEDEIAAMAAQGGLWRDFATATRDTVEGARGAIEEFAKAVGDGAVAARRPVQDLNSRVQAVTTKLEAAALGASELAASLKNATDKASETSAAFKQATDVVRELERLHASIVDLLSNDLFRASPP